MKKLAILIPLISILSANQLKIDVPPVNNAIYKKECGACHFDYPAGLLPSSSWNKMMGNLENHFGDDATLDDENYKIISNYLNQNSAEKNMSYKRSKKIVNSLGNRTSDTISKTPYIEKKHRDIKENLITQKEVKGLFNCTACHRSAEKGIFSKKDVDIPNYGKWEKKSFKW